MDPKVFTMLMLNPFFSVPLVFKIELGGLADWVAGLGSLAAVVVAIRAFKIVANQRASDKRDAEKAAAYELITVVGDIANHVFNIGSHFNTRRTRLSIFCNGELVTILDAINPLIGLSSEGEMKLPAGSTELLVKAGAVELWQSLRNLSAKNSVLTTLMKEYRIEWERLLTLIPKAEFTDHTAMNVSVTPNERDLLSDEFQSARQMIESLEYYVADSLKQSQYASEHIGIVLDKYFNENLLRPVRQSMPVDAQNS